MKNKSARLEVRILESGKNMKFAAYENGILADAGSFLGLSHVRRVYFSVVHGAASGMPGNLRVRYSVNEHGSESMFGAVNVGAHEIAPVARQFIQKVQNGYSGIFILESVQNKQPEGSGNNGK